MQDSFEMVSFKPSAVLGWRQPRKPVAVKIDCYNPFIELN